MSHTSSHTSQAKVISRTTTESRSSQGPTMKLELSLKTTINGTRTTMSSSSCRNACSPRIGSVPGVVIQVRRVFPSLPAHLSYHHLPSSMVPLHPHHANIEPQRQCREPRQSPKPAAPTLSPPSRQLSLSIVTSTTLQTATSPSHLYQTPSPLLRSSLDQRSHVSSSGILSDLEASIPSLLNLRAHPFV